MGCVISELKLRTTKMGTQIGAGGKQAGQTGEFVIKDGGEDASMLTLMLMFPFFFHFHPIFLLVSLFLYFLPAYLARNKSNFTAILVLNLLAGWTFIGWIIALVWALSTNSQRQAATPPQPTATGTSQPGSSGSFFCNSCGKPCGAGARFCSACGAAQPSAAR